MSVRDSDLIGLLPQLSEALQRPGGLATLDIALPGTFGHLTDVEGVDRLCPVLSVSRLCQLGPFSVVISYQKGVPPSLRATSSQNE